MAKTSNRHLRISIETPGHLNRRRVLQVGHCSTKYVPTSVLFPVLSNCKILDSKNFLDNRWYNKFFRRPLAYWWLLLVILRPILVFSSIFPSRCHFPLFVKPLFFRSGFNTEATKSGLRKYREVEGSYDEKYEVDAWSIQADTWHDKLVRL